jgi:Spy/CpxP family protein refolding chaperone
MRTLAILLLLTASTALAQPRPYFPWWEGRFTRDLDLSDEQRQEIRSIQKRYRDLMIDQRAAAEKADARLQDLFDSEEIPAAAAKSAVDTLVEARGAMTRSLTEMSVELRQVLTAEQWRDLQKKQEEMRDRMRNMRDRGRGAGRPRRPGGPPRKSEDPTDGPPPPPEHHEF